MAKLLLCSTSGAIRTPRHFAPLIIEDVRGNRTAFATKSQGPSAGGYSKPTQARERLLAKMKLNHIIHDRDAQDPGAICNHIAQIADSARQTGCEPVWKQTKSK